MENLNLFNQPPVIKGSDFIPELDQIRLTGQMLKVFEYMRNGKWRTLFEIADAINEPEASISAQLRHITRSYNGGHKKEKRRRTCGTWEYRIIPNHSSNGYTP